MSAGEHPPGDITPQPPQPPGHEHRGREPPTHAGLPDGLRPAAEGEGDLGAAREGRMVGPVGEHPLPPSGLVGLDHAMPPPKGPPVNRPANDASPCPRARRGRDFCGECGVGRPREAEGQV